MTQVVMLLTATRSYERGSWHRYERSVRTLRTGLLALLRTEQEDATNVGCIHAFIVLAHVVGMWVLRMETSDPTQQSNHGYRPRADQNW